jgi:two-component sensor histidine kinase
MKWFVRNIIPFGISIFLSLLIYLSIPIKFNKYKIEFIGRKHLFKVDQLLFADMDGDGADEEILLYRDTEGDGQGKRFGIVVRKYTGIMENYPLEQINIDEGFTSKEQMISADLDHNGKHELYFAMVKGNYVYLLGYDNTNLKEPFASILVDSFVRQNGVAELSLKSAIQFDTDHDNVDELYFSLRNSYAVFPRRVYRWNIIKNEIIASPSTCIDIQIKYIDSLSNGKIILTGGTGSSGNYKPSMDIPYSDYYCYSFVFDQDLKFLFNPIVLDKYPSSSMNFFYKGMLYSRSMDHLANTINIKKFDLTGKLLSTKELIGTWNCFILFNNEILVTKQDSFIFLNQQLGFKRKKSFDGLFRTNICMDIDDDGKPELFFLNPNKFQVHIVSSDGKHMTNINNVPFESNINLLVRRRGNEHSQLVLYNPNSILFYEYRRNPKHSLQYPYYLSIILLASFISFKSFSLYRKSIEKKYQQQSKMNRLQMLSIKNQVDPHFTLNALNSIDYLYQNDEKEKAGQYMVKLSRLIHQTLMNSDKMTCSLYDELDFIRTYCQLETVRSIKPFDFEIQVDEDIDPLEIVIPKQLIFTYVENAIKHGIRPKEDGGRIDIHVGKTKDGTEIIIRDNGIGIANSKQKKTTNTGKGLLIIEEIIKLYENLQKVKIKKTIESNNKGTVIRILLPRSKKSKLIKRK